MGPEGCEYCEKQKAEQALSSGQVILTDYLVENITKQRALRNMTLGTLEPNEVIPYLKENLHWRISDVSSSSSPTHSIPIIFMATATNILDLQQNNVDIPREDARMSDLKVSVAMGKATHFGLASEFSSYEDYQVLWEVTQNRPAGANPGDLGL